MYECVCAHVYMHACVHVCVQSRARSGVLVSRAVCRSVPGSTDD